MDFLIGAKQPVAVYTSHLKDTFKSNFYILISFSSIKKRKKIK